MFRINAFGQRIRSNPYLRYATDDDQAAAAAAAAAATAAALAAKEAAEKAAQAEKGFPENTPVAEMTVAQQAAYWMWYARKHENLAKARGDYDELKVKADELDKVKAENATDQEKAIAAAKEEARREGEIIGAGRYLKDAVTARFQLLTGKSDEDVTTAFEHVDAMSFTNKEGAVDTDALTKFASTFGLAAGGASRTAPDPVKEALERTRRGGGSSSSSGGGSIAEMQKQATEAITGKPSNT